MSKVSKRINELVNITEGPYDVVWDLCCDHGLIGEAFLKSNKITKKLIFVDQVKSIMENLENRVKASDITTNLSISFLTKSCKELEYKFSKKDLFVMAGIGGELSIEILKQIQASASNLDNATFIVSAHENIVNLREYLMESPFGLITEKLIEDKGKFYELLVISTKSEKPISICGKEMWQNPEKFHVDYLSNRLRYFHLKNRFENSEKLLNIIKELNEVRELVQL